jgi:hypothetical protein
MVGNTKTTSELFEEGRPCRLLIAIKMLNAECLIRILEIEQEQIEVSSTRKREIACEVTFLRRNISILKKLVNESLEPFLELPTVDQMLWHEKLLAIHLYDQIAITETNKVYSTYL